MESLGNKYRGRLRVNINITDFKFTSKIIKVNTILVDDINERIIFAKDIFPQYIPNGYSTPIINFKRKYAIKKFSDCQILMLNSKQFVDDEEKEARENDHGKK